MNSLVVKDDIQDFIRSYLFTGGPIYPPKQYKKWFGFLYIAKGPNETNDWKVGMTNYIKDRTKALARENVLPPIYVWSCPNVQVVETAVKQILVHFTPAGGDKDAEDRVEALVDENNGASSTEKYRSEIFYMPFPVLVKMIRLVVLYVCTREQWIASNFHFQTLDKYFQLKPEGIIYRENGIERVVPGRKIVGTLVTVRYPTEEELKEKWQLKQIEQFTTTSKSPTDLKDALQQRGEEIQGSTNTKELLVRLARIVFQETKNSREFRLITGTALPDPTETQLLNYAKTLYINPEWYGQSYRGIVRKKTNNNRYRVLFYMDNSAETVFPEFIYPNNSFDMDAVYRELNIQQVPIFPEDKELEMDEFDFDNFDIAEDITERKDGEEDLPLKF